MVARAMAAGVAIGAGAVMVVPQVFADSPVAGLVVIGTVLVLLGMIEAADLYAWERTHGNR